MICRVVDPQWSYMTARREDFFNYGLNPASWKAYCAQVKRCREQSHLKERIETFQTSSSVNPGADPSLPPELNAVLQAEHERVFSLHPKTVDPAFTGWLHLVRLIFSQGRLFLDLLHLSIDGLPVYWSGARITHCCFCLQIQYKQANRHHFCHVSFTKQVTTEQEGGSAIPKGSSQLTSELLPVCLPDE